MPAQKLAEPEPLTTTHTILQCNADGVGWFDGGQYRNAIDCFKHALTDCHVLLLSHGTQVTRPALPVDHAPRQPLLSQQVNRVQDVVLSLDETMHALSSGGTPKVVQIENQPPPHGASSSSWFMYNRPIQNPAPAEGLVNHPENGHLMTAILTFNLALAHHRLSVEENNVVALRRATRLYQCAVDVVLLRTAASHSSTAISAKESSESPRFWWGPRSTIFSLACVNNLGLCLLHLGETEAAREQFDCLMGMHMFLVVHHRQEEEMDLSEVHPHDMSDGYYYYIWNFSQLLFQDSHIVPPAA